VRKLERLYAGEWSKREIIKNSYPIEVAKDLGLSNKIVSNMKVNAWKDYKTYRKRVRKL
jgi:hypothetical protein